jgi:hypothetical protein
MSKKLSAVLVLCMSAVALSGCSWLRVTGPCYGVGCPGGTVGRNGQYKPGEVPKAQNASDPAPTKPAAAPAQSASAAAQPNIVQPNAPAPPAATNSPAESATTQPTAAQPNRAPAADTQATSARPANAKPAPPQNASAEAKPSPFHAIGEFFERLIPHHNSGANSGAGN